jgi:GNAT superfamily N-acetyltransferase
LIRRASVDDAAAIAGVQMRSSQWTYRGLMPDAHLDGRATAERIAERERNWQAQLAADSPRHAFVAERDGRLLGFAIGGPAEDVMLGSDCGELYAIYVEPDVVGSGVGRALFAAATEDLRTRGFLRAVLWVLEGNARARRFYEKAGWLPDGVTKIDERPDHVRHELRYAIAL